MKKLLLAFILFTMFSVSGYSQLGIGARGGIFGIDAQGNAYGGIEFSMQKIGSHEWDFGYIDGGSWKFTGLALFKVVGNPDGFLLYVGPGIGLGVTNDQFTANAALDVGVSLRIIKFLQLTLDYRPEWALTNNSITNTEFSWVNMAVGFRFVLGGD